MPVCHYRFEFSHYVRRAILAHRPAAVAIELPPGLKNAYAEAVGRFPYLSIVHYQTSRGRDMLVPVEPTDPFAEAIRTAAEAEIPVYFIDLNVDDYPQVVDRVPDSYAVYRLGLRNYWRTFEQIVKADDIVRTPQDIKREAHMAWHAQRLVEDHDGKEVMLVCGMMHVAGILRHLDDKTGTAERHTEMKNVRLLNPDIETIRSNSVEMPFIVATYEYVRGGPGPDKAWVPVKPPEPPPVEASPLDELSEQDVMSALHTLLGMGKPQQGPRPINLTPDMLRALAKRLSGMREQRLFFPLADEGAGGGTEQAPVPQNAPKVTPATHRIFKFKSVDERRDDLQRVYQAASAHRRPADRMLDRQRMALAMLHTAVKYYQENTGEKFQHWQLRTMVRYARSYARVTGRLLPDFVQWIFTARGIADDNYMYEVWDLGSFYPWQEEGGPYESVHIEGDVMTLGREKKEIHFHRRFPRFRERMLKTPVRKRKQEVEPGDWAKEFDGASICSYPPEDIIIEDYGRYLQKKALLVMSEERTRTEPFSSTMLDGIDVRETIRNWPDEKRIYVREIQKVSGGAGSVIMIFDEDSNDARYPWKMTWHGEHQQESDMAFYATPINAKIVGPGIARCEYGGLMLTYPPRRVLDVWSDPLYLQEAQSKAEVLLLAGLEYSTEKHVVYVASKAPRQKFRQIAARLGRKIVYLPIGQLSPVSIKKIRVFHVLSGHHLREIAKDYIW